MKLTVNWLHEFVDLPTRDPREIRDVLESLGHEVEDMQTLDIEFSGVVIGRVYTVSSHPNADKVRVCGVDVGGEEAEIVCGAWNFEPGALVPVALPGASLPGGFEIGRRKIRGVESHGMICSETELDLGDDADGIMVLNRDYPSASDSVGKDFASLLDLPDVYYEVSITPNRPDCMSVLGLARELAAYFDVPMTPPDVTLRSAAPDAAEDTTSTSIQIVDPEACARFAGREMRDVVVGPSPHWMRRRLTLAGVRPISNVVDASNYAMIEMGHPTHAFDRQRLGDTVIVRRAADSETIVTLDGIERTLLANDIVVADAAKPVAIAGVMGGAETEVREGTTAILIEAAYWEPPSVLLTSKRLGLRSEASARFERGMDPTFCQTAADRVAQLLEETAGATAIDTPLDAYPGRVPLREIHLALSEIPRHLGIELSAAVVTGFLERLGFAVGGSDPLRVTVPARRPDVAQSIDLIEEIARMHGFDGIPDRLATGFGGGLPIEEQNLRRLRSVLVGAGYNEALTFSFIGAADLDALALPADDPRRDGITVINPLRDEEGVMRTTLLPGLLKAAGENAARKLPSVSLFETGKVFLRGDDVIPDQPERVAFVATGSRNGDWEASGHEVGIRDATGVWELLAREMRIPDPGVRGAQVPGLHPGRAAEVTIAGVDAGIVGQVHPRVVAAFGLTGRVIAGELDLDALLVHRQPWVYAAPSQHPPVIFDLAFDVDTRVPAVDITAAIGSAGGDLLESQAIFDVFSGPPLPEGRKSIAVRLTLRAHGRTLTDEEVAPLRRSIARDVEAGTGAILRGEA